MNIEHAMLGNWLPRLFLTASALAAASAAMLIHSNHMGVGQQCLPCLCVVFLGLGTFFSLGGLVICQCLENTMEESGGLLEEIEAEIRVTANQGSCLYGRYVVRRHFPARLFQRRVIRWKMGQLNIERGTAADFLQQIMPLLMRSWSMFAPRCGCFEQKATEKRPMLKCSSHLVGIKYIIFIYLFIVWRSVAGP